MQKKKVKGAYVHGYNQREAVRLCDQASTLVDLLHYDTSYASGKVLEAGCGVGAQTVTLAKKSPDAFITSMDISAESLAEAAKRIAAEGITNVEFMQGDIFNLPFQAESFDHVFICFVLEHLRNPAGALAALKKIIRKGGTITVIEGDHGSAYFYPDSGAAHRAIQCQVELQKMAGGNSMIGRELYPLLVKSGFDSVSVSPRMVYADPGRPELAEGFTKNTFTAMIEGVREQAIDAGLIARHDFEKGIADLYRTAEEDGVFCYTFFKGQGVNK